MEEIIVMKMSVQELKGLISECVRECIQEHLSVHPKVEDSLLKIDDVANLLSVSKVTIHDWKRKGKTGCSIISCAYLRSIALPDSMAYIYYDANYWQQYILT
jgi:hypothetical protein